MSAAPGDWLWTADALAAAMAAERRGALPPGITGISIDTRTLKPGEAYFAIKGDVHDGHDFVAAALKAGAGVAVVAAGKLAALPEEARQGALLIVPDVLDALRRLAAAARARSQAKIIAVTGSVGKTSTKEALRIGLSADGETHASAASYNNHWGVPLSLARLPQSARYGVFEIGMNHAGEIEPLVAMVAPHVAIVTTVEPVHLEFFKNVEAIADAKAEIFTGLVAGGAAVINRDNPHYARLRRRARAAGVDRIVTFGEHPRADARLLICALHHDVSTVEAKILGERVAYKIGSPGKHLVLNSLAVLAAAKLADADLALAALALAEQKPASGRGTRTVLGAPGGETLLIDESYNANPTSMRAALALLAQAQLGPQGRRIAVLGDMLELGPAGAKLHGELADAIEENGIDLVFCAGPLMEALWRALPASHRGGYAATSAELEDDLVAAIRGGDALMVKGSLGSRMGPIVTSLQRRFPLAREADALAPQPSS